MSRALNHGRMRTQNTAHLVVPKEEEEDLLLSQK
jgi:hypothetical protein